VRKPRRPGSTPSARSMSSLRPTRGRDGLERNDDSSARRGADQGVVGVEEAEQHQNTDRTRRPERRSGSVDKEIEALFKKVDADWHLGPLPASLTAESVLNRLRGLIGETHENPLPVLAEVRMYQTRGLLQDAHLATAYQKLIGEAEGTQLAKGSEEEKKKAIEKWLPTEF